MTKQQTHVFLLGAIIVLAVAVAITIIFSPKSNTLLKDTGAALTIITLGSVGIERIIEGFWTYIGLTSGAWWPLNAISQQISSMASDLDIILAPFYQQLTNGVEKVKEAENWAEDKYAAAKQEIENFQQSINHLKKLTPGSRQSLAIANAASQLISNFQQTYKTGDTVATIANEAITGFAQFIVTPADNLGRRLISLFVGALLGLTIAGFFGLDLVQAIFTPVPPMILSLHLGTVLTGMGMGLGSSPTHEIIKVLQELKTNLGGKK